jgi:hypothetical protein
LKIYQKYNLRNFGYKVEQTYLQRLRLVQVATAILNRKKMFLQLAPNACYVMVFYDKVKN